MCERWRRLKHNLIYTQAPTEMKEKSMNNDNESDYLQRLAEKIPCYLDELLKPLISLISEKKVEVQNIFVR